MQRKSLFVPFLFLTFGSACFRVDHGSDPDGGGPPAADPPELGALARYHDVNGNGVADVGDRIVVPFDKPVRVNSSSTASFVLRVPGDAFGTDASVVAGPASHEVSVLLGAGANLKTRQHVAEIDLDPDRHLPSGIALADDLEANAIENAITGDDALPGPLLDIVPAFVEASALAVDPALDLTLDDFDRDGALDLMIALVGGGMQLMAGDDEGGFASGAPFGTRIASSLVAGDVDRDGIADVLLGIPDGIELWLGDGAGNFLPTIELFGLGEVRDVELGDLDLDGDVDGLVAGAEGLLVLQTVTSPFDTHVLVDGPIAVRAVALGDADGDGRVELFAATDEGLVVFSAAQGGDYEQTAELGETEVRALALADLDRDGALDVLTGAQGGPRVWYGDGQGNFEDAGLELGLELSPAVHVSDVDSDGRPDLILADPAGTRVLFQNAGEFVDCGQALSASTVLAIAGGDTDEDGDLDLVLAAASGGPIPCAGSLAGTWGGVSFHLGQTPSVTGITFALASSDIDGDGDLDVFAGQSGRLILVRGSGDGTFGATEVVYEFAGTRVNDVAPGDVDLDGDPDLVLGLQGAGKFVWLNDGAGQFTALDLDQESGVFTKAVELGDVDLDGDLDLAHGNMHQQPDAVRFNLGHGSGAGAGSTWLGFGPPVLLLGDDEQPLDVHTGDLRLADLDRDGDSDLACGFGPHTGNRWYRNDGSGGFAIQPQVLGVLDTRSVGAGDVDRDGDLDLVTGTAIGEHVFVNDGQGEFLELDEVSVSNTFQVQLVDLDGDGARDLLIGNSQTQGLGAWRNDGSGRFGDSPWFRLKHRSVRSILAEDFDRDGDADLLSSNLEEPTILLWLNR